MSICIFAYRAAVCGDSGICYTPAPLRKHQGWLRFAVIPGFATLQLHIEDIPLLAAVCGDSGICYTASEYFDVAASLRFAVIPGFATLHGSRMWTERQAAVCGDSGICYTIAPVTQPVDRAAVCGDSGICYTRSPLESFGRPLRFAVIPGFATLRFHLLLEEFLLRFAVIPGFATLKAAANERSPGCGLR